MRRLYTNDMFFLGTTMAGVAATIVYSVFGFLNYPECANALAINVLLALGLLTTYVSYKRHNKNVMKGMMGSVLMALLIKRMLNLGMNYIPTDRVCTVLSLIFTAGLFINHYAINSTRLASSWRIRLNQLLSILMAATDIVWSISWAVFDFSTGRGYIQNILSIFGMPCIVCAIVCIESRLDVYRLDREKSGWTEEKGYPEGYVHEYEKNS